MRRPVFALVLASIVFVSFTAFADATPRQTQEELYAPHFMAVGMRDLGALLACYQARPEEAQRALARLRSVSVRVKADGTLGRITPSPASAVPRELKSCFLEVASDWSVPPPTSGREIKLRFTKAHFF